ncbi:tandem-95 repeat protein [Luteolibacter yonseiensis]|uniref:Tandem-95 repeat protein n=2 Tax=Luteolibacter yonseiensis TaxID=1144680 RepID=A0A934R6V8_9BACT|nr:right-handed parallel beta-helix repeat-containing protein [Luteolibacter yonseiensis]MBK1818069.1 tandem-95 repeat protein [Luteolibacter yonseiensis]
MKRALPEQSHLFFPRLWLLLGLMFFSANASAAILRVASDATHASPDGSTWAKAYPDLQTALAAAAPGTEIWIKTGTYKPTTGIDRTVAFRLKNNMILRGGFRGDEATVDARSPWGNPTVLSGDIGTPMIGAITALNGSPALLASNDDPGWADNSYNVVVGDGVEGVTLEFLTITGGAATNTAIDRADIDGYEMYADVPETTGAKSAVKPYSTVVGGGLYFNTGSTWTAARYGLQMLNCRFARNQARGYGGAVALYDGSAFIGGCEFEQNLCEGAAGAFWGLNQQSGFVQSTFSNNFSKDGGGAVKIMGIPSERASDANVDGFNDTLRSVAFSIYGLNDETATREKIGSLLTAYGVYKASNKFITSEGGFFSKFASTIPNPFAKGSTQVGGATVTNTNISPGSRLMAAYAVVQIGFAAADNIVKVLDHFGKLDKNSADYKRWVAVNEGFNKYATPQGLISLGAHAAINAALPGVSPDLIGTKKAGYENYTEAGRSAFASCTFTGNEAGNEGGAIELVFNNLLVENCTFTKNRAESNGGAISSAMWNMPQVISSVFANNTSTDGTSAVANSFNSIMMMVNCTVINNKSETALGKALSAAMGADVRVYNSILWNNANKTVASGADVEAVTESMLDENARARYNALQGEQVNWLGIMDIRNSIIQSLDTIPLGTDRIAPRLAGVNLSQSEINAAIAATREADARGELESSGAVNVGEGVRPKLRDPAYGNSSADPMLVSSPKGKPSVQSPANNAGANQWITWKMISHAVDLENIMDVAGKKRVLNSRVDIGAYEVDSTLPDSSALAGTTVEVGAGSSSNPVASGVGAGSAGMINATIPSGVAVYYVRPTATGNGSGLSWANATSDLAAAVSHANAEVWVAAGTYRPTTGSDRNASFSLADGVRVFGGFAGTETTRAARDWKTRVTIISGDIGTPNVAGDNSKNLFKNTNARRASSTVLDGFTLRDAYSSDADGGAILNVDSAPLVRNCVFLNNHARNGGAIHSSGLVEGSILVNCEFRNNSAEAAGGAVSYAHTLFGNNLVFNGNTAGTAGGAISVTGSIPGQFCTIQNGLFSNNASASGAGGAISSSMLQLNVVNSTFYGNSATATSTQKTGGGAIDDGTSVPADTTAQIFNSIFYKNTAVNLGTGGGQTVEKQQIQSAGPLLRNSLVHGLSTFGGGPINGNFSGDPQFVTEGTDFRLLPTSLAIDSGDSGSIYTQAITLDLAGASRLVNGKIDLGPYEHSGAPAHPVKNVAKTSVGTESYIFSTGYTAVSGDTLRWYVDRGDGLGYVALTEREENQGVATGTLTVSSRPNGFSYRLQLTHNGLNYLSPVAILEPTAESIYRYVYVKPVATGDGSGSSWINATSDLRSAIARTSAEVWVAAGTYAPTSGTDRDASFSMGDGVEVYGGFKGNETRLATRDWRANPTIISGAIGGSGAEDNTRHLFRNTDVGSSAVLDGLYLQDAHAEGEDGGAIQGIRSNPSIRNCVFRNNHARNGGAISSTDTTGVAYGSKLFNCEFHENSAELGGGAIYIDGSWAGANLLFKDNTAQTGGAIQTTGDMDGQNCTVQNSLFAGNRATAGTGGAIWAKGMGFYVINSTLYGNRATVGSTGSAAGGGVSFDKGSGNASLGLYNSIFYKNTAVNTGTGGVANTEKQQISLAAGSFGGAKNSLIHGLQTFTGNGNFDGDPVFLQEGTNFHVAATSPTIESGSMNEISSRLETTDLDGNNRIIGTIDLGPYEHPPTPANPIRKIAAASSGLESYSYTATDYDAQEGDILAWQVDRGDGTGFGILGANDPGDEPLPDAYLGLNTPSLTVLTPPSNFLFRLRLIRGASTYYSPVSRLRPTEMSKAAYVYVRPVATGDGSGTGWADATSDLQAAMAKPNAQVWVQEGTYYPTTGTDRNASFSINSYAVKVYGGFKGTESLRDARKPTVRVTRISGNIGSSSSALDNSRHLFRNENVGASTILDGLTFENAYSDDEDGGAILNISSSPTIQNCVFRDNHARNGGAVASTGTPGYLFGSDITGCRFENNTAELTGGAISYNSSVSIENCIFKNNRAGSGGAVALNGTTAGLSFNLKNGLFFGNRSLDGRGGAISSQGISLRLTNSTFYGNQAKLLSATPLGGSAVYQDHTIPGAYTVELYNSIFYNNSAVNSGSGGLDGLEDQQVLVKGDGPVFANHSLVQGLNRHANIPQMGNFDEAPGFVDINNENFRLASASPAINSGTASYGGGYLLTETDLEGNARVSSAVVDLGPYEYTGPAALGRVIASSDFSGGVLRFIRNTTFAVEEGDVLVWYVDRGDGNFVPLTEDGVYSGVNSRTLTITAPPAGANGYLFRLQVVRGGTTLTTTSTRLTLPPARIYVDAARLNMSADGLSWHTAFGSLADALKVSGPGTAVWVAGGTYLPTSGGDTNASFQIPLGVKIYGGFHSSSTALVDRNPVTRPTILSGRLNGATNRTGYSRHVVSNHSTDRTGLLDGFILEDSYSGLLHNDGASPTIRNCVFRDNDSSRAGDGYGAAMSNINGANPLIAECQFLGNTGVYGGALYIAGASATVENSVFARNSASGSGGAVFMKKGTLDLVHCTVADNTSKGTVAALYAQDSTVKVSNSIFWNNRTTYQGWTTYERAIRADGGTLMFRSSCIDGLTSLTDGNVKFDPIFDPARGGDYALALYSPLVNAASTVYTTSSTTDLLGRPRVRESAPDMGAYELAGNAAAPVQLNSLPRSRTAYNIGGSVDFTVSWPVGTTLNPAWTLYIGTTPLPAGRYTFVTGPGFSTVRVNGLSLLDSGLKVSFSDTARQVNSIPSAILTVKEPRIVRVNPVATGTNDGTSWLNAYTSLSRALENAETADEIWVTGGTHTPVSAPNFNLNGAVNLFGGFAGTETTRSQRNPLTHPTILHAVGTNPVFYAATPDSDSGLSSAIDGFTIGDSTGPATIYHAGVIIAYRNCVFRNNAGYLGNFQSQVQYENCEFTGNTGNLFIVDRSTVTLGNSRIHDNTTSSDLLTSSNESTVVISDTVVNGNTIAGAFIRSGSGTGAHLTVLRSAFRGNTTGGAIIANNTAGTCVIEGSLFAKNIASGGMATLQNSGSLSMTFSTVADNRGGSFGGGLYTYRQAASTIKNSIFWGNRGTRATSTSEQHQLGDPAGTDGMGTVTVGQSIIESVPTPLSSYNANNNMSFYPLFVDPSAGDYHLSPNSPAAITSNASNMTLLSSTDLDKVQRRGFYGAAGAYESPADSGNPLLISNYPTSTSATEGTDTSFTYVGHNFKQWQYLDGNGNWVTITGDTGSFRLIRSPDGTTRTLYFDAPSLAMNGARFRAVIERTTGGVTQTITSGDLVLTVTRPQVIYVNGGAASPGDGKSWATAFGTIQQALAVTNEYSEIWVQGGSYDINTASLKWNVHLYGGFAGNETARADRNVAANEVTLLGSGRQIFLSADSTAARNAKTTDAVLDGFTLIGANDKTAVYLSNSESVIRNCTFRGNGGAIEAAGQSNPVIANCVFDSHSSTVLVLDGDAATISGCSFLNNVNTASSGTTVYIYRGNVKITDSTFSGNVNNGALLIAFSDYSSTSAANVIDGKATQVTMNRCAITGNSAYAVFQSSQALLNLDNSLVARNTVYAPAIRGFSQCQFNLTNVTIAHNNGATETAGIANDGRTNLKNSILWGNRTSWPYAALNNPGSQSLVENSQIKLGSQGTVISNSLVEGAYVINGNGNDGYDPLFIDADAGNYQLPAFSPAVNRGTASGIPTGALDLASTPRIQGSNPDSGAYEFTGTAVSPIQLKTNHGARAVVVGRQVQYSVQTTAGVNVQWQVKSGGSFVNVVSGGDLVLSGNGSIMTLNKVPLSMNGTEFRFVLSGNATYTSSGGVLTVTPKTILYVNAGATGDGNGTSWANAFTSVNGAILAAADPLTGGPRDIWVSRGTYDTYTSLPPGVDLYGGFAGVEAGRDERNVRGNPTILIRNSSSPAATNILSSGSYTDTLKFGEVIDGFTFTGSTGGITVSNAPLLVRNCTFSGLAGYGVINVKGPLTVEDCTFNQSGSVAVVGGPSSTTTIRRSIFQGGKDNSVQSSAQSVITVEDSVFQDNTPTDPTDPVVYVSTGSTVNLVRSKFVGNHNNSVVNNDGRIFIRQSLFADNHGAGVDMTYRAEATQLVSCTIAGNDQWGIGIGWQNQSLRLTNCIIAGNGFRQQIYTDSGGVFASYTLVQGETYGGTGNMSWDPLFTDAGAGDYTLSARSPAVNAGNAAAVNAGETDVTGAVRIQSGLPDLGAYESSHAPDPLYRSALPTSLATIRGVDGVFSITGDPSYTFTWQYKNGSEWITITFNNVTGQWEGPNGIPVIITTVNGVSKLTFPSPALAANGIKVRVTINGQGVTSEELTLTVNEPETMYVDASVTTTGDGKTWATAFKTLDEALVENPTRLSPGRRIIRIAKGTYTAPVYGFGIRQRVEIYGGYPNGGGARDVTANPVILSGERGDPSSTGDNSDQVLSVNAISSPIAADTIFDGFSVVNGKRGISVTSNARPTLRNLIVSRNTDGGLSISSAGGRVENCQFLENTSSSGAGASFNASTVTLSGSTFRGNVASGSGGAISIFNGSVRMENLVVTGNKATGSGGGINISGGNPHVLLNSTVVGNFAGEGGGLYAYISAGASIRNSIIWGNRASSGSLDAQQYTNHLFGGGFSLQTSNVEGRAAGGPNLGFAPIFYSDINAADAPMLAGDFRLQGGSPGVDAGDNSLLEGLAIDADNAPRAVRTVDLGAYEFQGSQSDPLIITQQPADLVLPVQAGPGKFQVVLAGSNYVFQWEYSPNGIAYTPVVDGTGFSGARTSTLQLLSDDPTKHGYFFRVKVNGTNGGAIISRSAVLSVYPQRYFVNAAAADDNGDGYTWATAFKTVGTAFTKARLNPTTGVQFWVAGGTYRPSETDTAAAFPLRSKVELYGGFSGTETELAQRNIVSHPTVLQGIAGTSSIFASVDTTTVTGIRIDGFSFNTATTGVSIGKNSTLTVANCSFDGLGTGIKSIADAATIQHWITVKNCRFTGMTQAGINTVWSSLNVTDSVLTANRQGMVLVQGNSYIGRSEFRGNGAADVNGGGLKTYVVSAAIESCLFSGNFARYGGGIYSEGGDNVVYRNCTIAGNYGVTGIGGFNFTRAQNTGRIEMYNTIVWGNATGGLSQYTQYLIDANVGGGVSTSNNDVQDAVAHLDFKPANGNLTIDPGFVAPVAASATGTTAGDYRLSPQSSLINRGSNALLGGSATDLAGATRVFETTVDMGAYEFPLVPIRLTTQPVDANAGDGIPGVFSVAANFSEVSYQWQVSLNGTWTDLVESSTESGVQTPTLTVTGGPSYHGRLYRVHVTTATAGDLYSNAATYIYVYATAGPEAGIANQMLTGPISKVSFVVDGGVLPASILDGSFAVHGSQTGRLSLADGSLTGYSIAGNTVSLQTAVPFKAGEQVQFSITGGLKRLDGYSAFPATYQFRAGSRSRYGIFTTPGAISGASSANALASGDVNGDGSVDLVIGGANGAGVWLNNGAGVFTQAGHALGSGAVSQVLVGSLGITRSSGSRNRLDVVLRKAGGDVEIWRNDGDGAFGKTSTLAGLSATSLGLADLNGDGTLDLFIATAGADQVWFNNGDGTFTDSTQRLGSGAGLSVAFGDYDSNSRLDVFTANGDGPMEIWNNDGTGRYSTGPTPTGGETNRVITADFDKDGRLDVIGVRNNGAIRIYRQATNSRTFNFTNQTTPVGLSVADAGSLNVADLDNDGFADLVFPYQFDNNLIQVWRGTGFDGSFARFQKIIEQPAFAMSKALDLVDLNGDGMMDSVFISASGVPMVSYYVGTPAAPTGLVATAESDTRISLAWTDNSTGETNYSVERSPNGSTNWTVLSSTLAADSASYVDAGRSPSTPYFYRVRSNVGILYSGYSPTAGVTTPAAVVASADAIAMLENGTATTLVSGAASVLANDSSPADLTAAVVTPPAHGNLTFSTDGTFSYSPAAGYSGTDVFTYRATNGVTHASAVGTVSITVTRLNEAPATLTLAPASGTLYTGQTAGLTVATLSATDPDPEDAGLLTFSLVAGEGSAGNADFVITGAKLKTAGVIDAAGGLTRSVRIRVTDTLGLFRETIHTMTFTRAPAAAPATFVTDEDTAVAVLLSGTGGAAPLGYTIVSSPSHGSLAPGANGNAYTYTPAANFNGSDSFTYRVTDSVLTSAAATVTINVTPVNDPPTLAAVAPVVTVENTPVSFTLAGSDVDGDAITSYQLTSTPTLGRVQVNGAVVTYTPFTNVLGTETLTFTVTAGGQTSAPLEVIVVITGEPVTSLVYRGLSETTTIPAAPGDWSNPAIAITNPPAHGTVVNTGTDFLYTHDGGSATGDTYTYTATNTGGEIRTITVAITISDHVIIVNSTDDDTLNATDDAGHTTLKEALAIVDRFWDKPLAGTSGTTADWTIRIASRPRAYVLTPTGYEGGFAEGYRSAFRIRGKVSIEAPLAAGLDAFVIKVPYVTNTPRNFLVTPGARLSLRNLVLRGGQGTAVYSAGQPAGSNVSRGGGIYNLGTFTADNVIFDGLTAHTGAAIYNNGGTVVLRDCDFGFNNSTLFQGSDGGTIWSRNGSLSLEGVALDDNENPELFVVGDGALATVDVYNSLIRSAGLIKRNGGTLAISGLPLAVDDTVTYPVGAPLTFGIDTLLANDFGTPLKNITVSPTSAKGIPITRDGNNLTYNADAALDGDSFTYSITMATDQRLSSSESTSDITSTATVTLDFDQLAGFPGGVADSGTVYRGLSTDINVLANDTDPTGDPLAIASFSQPAHGTVTKVGSVLRYTHDNSAKADPEDATPETDSFTYSVSNSTGTTENVRVDVMIRERVLVVNSGQDSGPGTLRAAISFINSFTSAGNPSSSWTIRIATGANDRWSISSGTDYGDPIYRSAFEIRGDITIDAGDSENFELGTSLDWNSPTSLRLFLVSDNASLTLKNLKLTGSRGGNFFNRFVGGAVLNFGSFTAENVGFQYFEAQLGAAIFNDGGDVVLTGCDFHDNSVRYPGGANLGIVVSHNGDLTLDDVSFTDWTDTELYVYGDGTEGAIVRFLTVPDYSRLLSGNVTTPGLPFVRDDTAETRSGATLNIPISTLLANDSDTADTTLTVTYSGVGSVAINGSSITYSNPNWFEGQDSFTYTLTTASGYSSTATVRIDVTPLPPAPRIAVYNQNYNQVGDGATMDFGTVQSGTSQGNKYTVTVMNQGNDYGSSLNIGLSLEGDHSGDFEINEFGNGMNPWDFWNPYLYPNDSSSFQVIFRPSGPGVRTTSLHLRSNDPEKPDFKLTLTGFVNTVPTFDGYAANVPHNTPVPLSLAKILAKAHDEDGDTLSFTNGGTTANGGTLVRNATVISYIPPDGFSGEDSFPITIRDTHGSTITVTVTLQVAAPVDDSPLAGNPNPPKLTIVNGDIKLDFQGIPNRAYDIERSVNLGAWEVIATRNANHLGKIEFTDVNPPSGSGFYRIKKH